MAGTEFPFNVINQTVNRVTRPMLRSPAHGVLSDKLLLLTVTGRRSGRRFSIPMNYLEQGGRLLLQPSRRSARSGGATCAARARPCACGCAAAIAPAGPWPTATSAPACASR